MIVHRSADIQEQQYLDDILALGLHFDVEPAARARRGVDGIGQRQFAGHAAPCKAAQPPQSDLDVARAQFHLVVEVGEFAFVPDFDGAAIAPAVLADSHTLRVEAIRSVWRGPRRADPLAPALMPLLLLLE